MTKKQAKRQLNVRLSEPGWSNLNALVKVYGSKTIVIELAIARLYTEEKEK